MNSIAIYMNSLTHRGRAAVGVMLGSFVLTATALAVYKIAKRDSSSTVLKGSARGDFFCSLFHRSAVLKAADLVFRGLIGAVAIIYGKRFGVAMGAVLDGVTRGGAAAACPSFHEKLLEPVVEAPRENGAASEITQQPKAVPHDDETVWEVARRDGRLQNVQPALRDYHRFDETGRQISPFLYSATHGSTEVIVKVYRDGDHGTNRKEFQTEMDFFIECNSQGVPTPMVIQDGVSAMDLERVDEKGTTATYHVLVTESKSNDNVDGKDILPFALQLVQAMRRLHQIGILHCDMKLGNLLWSHANKTMDLIDFGHSMRIGDNLACRSTEGYEAPEIIKGFAHTTKTDAFSVGKTIQRAISKATDSVDLGSAQQDVVNKVGKVATLLVRANADTRLTLFKAESSLRSIQTAVERAAVGSSKKPKAARESAIKVVGNVAPALPKKQRGARKKGGAVPALPLPPRPRLQRGAKIAKATAR